MLVTKLKSSQSNIAPKLDTEPVVLSSNFAVQLLPRESYRDVAKLVLATADEAKVLFRKLEVMELMTVGTTTFVRFRSDLRDVGRVCERLAGRSYVAERAGAYVVHFIDGRAGRLPATSMCLGAKAGFGVVFTGPRIAKWKAQFQ